MGAIYAHAVALSSTAATTERMAASLSVSSDTFVASLSVSTEALWRFHYSECRLLLAPAPYAAMLSGFGAEATRVMYVRTI